MSGNICPHGIDVSNTMCPYCENEKNSEKSKNYERTYTVSCITGGIYINYYAALLIGKKRFGIKGPNCFQAWQKL